MTTATLSATTTIQGLPATRLWRFEALASGLVRMSDCVEYSANGQPRALPANVYTVTAEKARGHWRNLTAQGYQRAA